MNRFLFTIALLSLALSASASSIIKLNNEINIPLPDGWIISDTTADFPYQIINEQQSGELLIFKSIIDEDEIITNKTELKTSVDLVIEDVILTIPGAKIKTNTGYFDDNRVSFVLEFSSIDSLTRVPIHHRLKGIIYQHPDGYQLLFTLWAKTDQVSQNLLNEELAIMMDDFSYFGPARPEIFTGKSESNMLTYVLILIGVIILLLIYFRRKPGLEGITHSDDSHFWRCSCGRQNHINHDKCHRCGKDAPSLE